MNEDKKAKQYEAVKKYRAKIGLDKLREMNKNYTQKTRKNPEYRKIENEKNKDRYRKKLQEDNITVLNTKISAMSFADKIINNLVNDNLANIPLKRPRGRPRMTEEQKAQIYGSLLNEHTKCFNEINRIKGESLELNREQMYKIQQLEERQRQIMNEISSLLR
jgi:hypothetical protein